MKQGGVAFALDVPDLNAARAMALTVRDGVGMLKIGLELFAEAGPAAMAVGAEAKLPVFLDLKLHDIPETVERAVARVAALGASVLTVHASGGPAMLRRAVARAASERGGDLRIAAVTVLTSFDATDLLAIGVGGDVAAHAVRLAKMAHEQGVTTFVCSPHEAAPLREALGRDVILITPGVRSGSAAANDDQKRVMSAGDAVKLGADWVVVGRPIRDAADPLGAARALSDEVRAARAARAQAGGRT